VHNAEFFLRLLIVRNLRILFVIKNVILHSKDYTDQKQTVFVNGVKKNSIENNPLSRMEKENSVQENANIQHKEKV